MRLLFWLMKCDASIDYPTENHVKLWSKCRFYIVGLVDISSMLFDLRYFQEFASHNRRGTDADLCFSLAVRYFQRFYTRYSPFQHTWLTS